MAPKFVKISNVEIKISNYTINDENVIIGKTQNLRSPRNSAGGRIGIIIPTFSSDLNRAPIDEWSKVWSDPALLGASCVSNAIVDFTNAPINSSFITSNEFAQDFTHPLSVRNITKISQIENVPVRIEYPKKEWITAGENDAVFRMYSLLYHKFWNMVIFRSGYTYFVLQSK